MAIYAYDFTTGDIRNTVAYFKQFLSLMVKNLSDPKTIDFFSSVSDVKDIAKDTITINCYVSGGTVPAIQFAFKTVSSSMYFAIDHTVTFNGQSSWEYAYAVRTKADDIYVPNEFYYYDNELHEYILVTSETAPDDWESGYQNYYTRYISNWAITDEWDPSYSKPRYGFLTSKGVLIINEGGQAILISKTNNGDLALTYPEYSDYLTSQYNVAADGDTLKPSGSTLFAFQRDIPVSTLSPPISCQTVLTPVTTNRTDVSSYLNGVYVLPQSQFRQKGIIEVGSTRYATNGYFALQE